MTTHPEAADFKIVTGNTAHTKPENRAFYPALDGLRAIAFLMVFGQHYLETPWGWTGVDLFFVLSGFLITGILFDSRDDLHRVRNFYLRRTLRIFPLYYGIMLAFLMAGPLVHWNWNWHWLVWPAYIGNYARFVHPYAANSPLQQLADFQPRGHLGSYHLAFFLGHFWSLCVEEQFYLFWPWLVFWIRDRRKLLWICAATLPVCLAMRLAGNHMLPNWMLDNEVLYRATPFRLDALLIGGLIALLLRGPYAERLLRLARWVFPVALFIAAVWFFFISAGTFWQRPYPYPSWKFTWGLTAVDVLSALLILVAVQPGSITYRILKVRPLRWLGRISYGAYVLHDIPHPIYAYIAQHIVASHHFANLDVNGQVVVFLAMLAFVATLFLAWISFRYFESPFLNLKERWTVRG